MRTFLLFIACLVFAVVSVTGFRGTKTTRSPIEIFPDMVRQAKVKEQAPSLFFPDGRASRYPVAGTVPTVDPVDRPYLSTGMIGDYWGDGIPIPVNAETMKKGKERFEIFCSACHGATGMGNGIATQYGLVGVPNYHSDHTRQMPDGQIFYVITHGQGLMLGYGANLSVEERWAIVAYIRALQLSQNATLADVPIAERPALEGK
ncbi:Cytochrome c family protein [Methylacidimicrobium sp. AP8]|uniref:c-type cytochrome n=1 Tax=Methylacidimicrobium sp. AP8 TaxID=2730359 RepID=UPI0018C0E98C|nr:cytochrome c [Methylacidimicrobium sp. AP8]CAB4244392.1 Cytochrome c family protein [Methylacidimicrobium sp. AP8]